MYVFEHSTDELAPWIRDEVDFPGPVARGARGMTARRVQEWLNLHGLGLVVDGDFGPVTTRMVAAFQEQSGLPATATVDVDTFATLVQPMVQVLAQRLDQCTDLGAAVLEYAYAHLDVHPREVGGANSGPWVRMYMHGNQGVDYPWCAGFVSFLIEQAAESMRATQPIPGSFSCDALAEQARRAGRLLPGTQAGPTTLPAGSLFLVRRSATDWTHTGLVTAALEDSFDTIEGNTNDDGNREGVEVCARSRGYTSKDFGVLASTVVPVGPLQQQPSHLSMQP